MLGVNRTCALSSDMDGLHRSICVQSRETNETSVARFIYLGLLRRNKKRPPEAGAFLSDSVEINSEMTIDAAPDK